MTDYPETMNMELHSWNDADLTEPKQDFNVGEDSFWNLKLDFDPPLVGVSVTTVYLCVNDDSVAVAEQGCQAGQRRVDVTDYEIDDSNFASAQQIKVRLHLDSSFTESLAEAEMHVLFNVQRRLTNANYEQQLYYKMTDNALAMSAPFTVNVLPYSPSTSLTPDGATSDKFPDWAIAVIVVGGALIIAGVITLTVLMVKRNNAKKSDTKMEMK